MLSFYLSHKDGYEGFTIWKRKWSTYGTTEATMRTFMSETLLPYWVQCKQCSKWRQLSKDAKPLPNFLKEYVCGMSISGVVVCTIKIQTVPWNRVKVKILYPLSVDYDISPLKMKFEN